MVLLFKKILLIITCFWLFLNTSTQYSNKRDTLYAHIPLENNNPIKAVKKLVERIIPNHVKYFTFQQISKKNGNDVFVIEEKNGKINISGNNGVSMASGLNWYLKYQCHCHISLFGNNDQLQLPLPLPRLKQKIFRISPFKYRYFFNYCTFGYTMAWWGWAQWERIIDYMVLNGINMPLSITGQEAVWQLTLTELGYNMKQIQNFLAGPAYLPWKWMGNIEGLAGPLPQSWIAAHIQLQKKILQRERAFGMTPILQGFTGHVPVSTKEVFPKAILRQASPWAGMSGTWFIDPQDPLFQKFGTTFLKKQTELFGTDHLYNADCFNEINPPTNDINFISNMGKSIYLAMHAVDPQALWVLQGWFLYWQADFWQIPQARALFNSVPNDKIIALDLYAESHPVWNKTEAFFGKPWIWSVLSNLSQKVNISGHLELMQENLYNTIGNKRAGNLIGIGLMMEGLGYNPIVQDFIAEKTWRSKKVNIEDWISQYAHRRYGIDNKNTRLAWKKLFEGPYSRNMSNAYDSIITSIPKLTHFTPTIDNPYGIDYDALKLTQACQLLLSCSDILKDIPSYRFDITHFMREMLVNLANRFNAKIARSYRNRNQRALIKHSDAFLELILDIDLMLGSNENFLLGKWIKSARNWGISIKEKNDFEFNARTIITMWEPARKSQLRDYASKQWNGMLKDFYYPRWKMFLDRLSDSIIDDQPLNKRKFLKDLKEFELRWIRKQNKFPDKPSGDTLEIAHQLFKKYISYYQ